MVAIPETFDEFVIPDYVIKDLARFISIRYIGNLPHSLLISQAFILKYPEYGKKYGLSVINKITEDGIKEGLFSLCNHQGL